MRPALSEPVFSPHMCKSKKCFTRRLRTTHGTYGKPLTCTGGSHGLENTDRLLPACRITMEQVGDGL